MKGIILIAACFFLFQDISFAAESTSKNSRLQRNELPRAFLPKSGSEVTINKKGESISLGSIGSTMEEILQRISQERNVSLSFYCNDPSLNQEKSGKLTISADSLLEILQQLLPADCRFSLLNRDRQKTESSKDIAFINIYPKECAGTDPPVRVFVSQNEQRLRARPLEEISLEELNDILERQGPSSRRRAADTLGIKGDEKGIPYAKKALRDPNQGVMFAAANALKKLGNKFGYEKVSDALYERFLQKPYAEFLPIMAEVDRDRFFAIIGGLMGLGGEREKMIMARALFMTNDRRAIQYLSTFANTDTIEISRQAIYAIGKIGGPEAANTLVDLAREGDADRQAAAVQAISFLAQGEKADLLGEIEKVLKAGKISDQSLKVLADYPYVELLGKLMKDPDTTSDLKVRVLRAMAERGSEKTIEIMSIGLNDKAPQVRLASVQAMGAAEAAIPYLVSAAEDTDAKVRYAAVRGLGQFSSDFPVAKALAKAVYDSDEKVRRAAVDGLSRLEEPSGPVIEILKDCEKNHEDPYVAGKAAHTLRSWKGK
jgi:HEAT repeat protein